MDAVVRGMVVYLVLLLVFRLVGKRSLAQITTFDFVLLLVISEATQQALLREDFSIIQAALVIAALVGLDRLSDFFSFKWTRFQRYTESVPLILIHDGKMLEDVMAKEHISPEEIMAEARKTRGLERLDQIKWAIQETSGGISVIPWENASPKS